MDNARQTSQAKNILCVDDDRDTCELIEFMLDEHRVKSVAQFEEALRLIETESFDLFIFDNWLGGGSGIDLCRRVRELGIKTPILFVSGVAQQSEIQSALASGANRYLTKPSEPDELKQIVKELLG